VDVDLTHLVCFAGAADQLEGTWKGTGVLNTFETCSATCNIHVLAGLALVARRVDSRRSLVLAGLALVARRVDSRRSLVLAGLALVARRVDSRRSLVLAGL